jgi:hypothetical protein
LICWDRAHRDLWQQYAGRVDMMLIASCPPDVSNPTYIFPDGQRVTADELGPVMGSLKGDGRRVFGDMINQQTGWLGVPAVNTVGCGQITTDIPAGTATLLSFMPLAPRIAQYLPQAKRMQMQCDMVQGCKIVNANGVIVTELSQDAGETFAITEVTLVDEKPQPQAPQPPATASPISYLASDYILPLITTPVYRQGLRQTWGRHMAPINAASRRWLIYLGITSLLAFILGRSRR